MDRAKSLRKMPPKTREIAKIINETESIVRRLKNRLPVIYQLEIDAQALAAGSRLNQRIDAMAAEAKDIFAEEPEERS